MAPCIRPVRSCPLRNRAGHREDPKYLLPLFYRGDRRTKGRRRQMTPQALEAKPLHAARWTELPERGAPISSRITGWIAVHIGRPIARLLLYPITIYFVLTGR